MEKTNLKILFFTLLNIENLDTSNLYIDLIKEFLNHNHEVYLISPYQKRDNKKPKIIEIANLHILKPLIGNYTKTNLIEKFINQFNAMKELMIDFAAELCDVDASTIDEENFPIKIAGFLAQYVMPSAKHQGRPSEEGLVDVYGNSIKFDGTQPCLTLTQP
jgi:hypothetical protein